MSPKTATSPASLQAESPLTALSGVVSHSLLHSFFAGRTTSSYENLKKFAAERKYAAECERQAHHDASPFASYEGVEGLRQILVKQYGNLVKAWQLGFDVEGRGWINFAEFNAACRNVGFERHIRKAFRQLDHSGKGNVTLQDLDPESTKAHELFKSCLVQRYGSLLGAFRALESGLGWKRRTSIASGRGSQLGERRASNLAATLADFRPQENLRKSASDLTLPPASPASLPSAFSSPASAKSLRRSSFSSNLHSGLLDMEDFKQVCKDIRYGGDAGMLFRWLDADQAGAISIEEIDPRVALTLWKGGAELDLMEAGVSTSRTDPNKLNRQGSAMDAAPTLASLRYKLARVEQRKKVEEAERQAKANLVCAQDCQGFKKLLVIRFGTLVSAWKSCLDKGMTGRVSYCDFCRSCRELGYGDSVRRLFNELDRNTKGFVSLYDIDDRVAKLIESLAARVSEEWGSTQGAWEGTFNPRRKARISLAEFGPACRSIGFKEDPAALLKALDCSRSGGLSFRDFSFLEMWFAPEEQQFYSTMTRSALRRMKIGRENRERIDRESEDCTLAEFRVMLEKRFGNYVRAWRQALDTDRSGRITYIEFCKACREMGVPGSLKRLWQEIDDNNSGSISIDEIDFPTGELLQEFASAVTSQCNSWAAAWNLIFDPSGAMRISRAAFKEACETLNFEGNVEKLFRWLDVDHSHYMTLDKMQWITDAEASRSAEAIREAEMAEDEERQFVKRRTLNELLRETNASTARRLTIAHDSQSRKGELVSSPSAAKKKSTEAALSLAMLGDSFGSSGKRRSTMQAVIKEQLGSGNLSKDEIRAIESNLQKRLMAAQQNCNVLPLTEISWGDGWDPEFMFMEEEEEDY